MEDIRKTELDEKLKSWIKQRVDAAVSDILKLGLYSSVMVEAKPAWVFPFGLLIGKIRERNQSADFDWFICGDFPTAMAPSSLGGTPREIARHFALKWQLEAHRQTVTVTETGTPEPNDQLTSAGNQLVKMAESLYELVEQDSLWQE